jgi:hypothetical protein
MTGTIEELRGRMEAAAAALDYEEAKRLRDRISLLRSAGPEAAAEIDTTGLDRQQPGRMGLGTTSSASPRRRAGPRRRSPTR